MTTKRSRSGEVVVEVAGRLRQARKEARLTQEDMASYLGLSRAGYGHLEGGARLLTIEDLVRLSKRLNRSVAWFLGLDAGLTDEEDQLLTAYRVLPPGRERKLVLDIVKLAADRALTAEPGE